MSLGFRFGKCKWCEYFCEDVVSSNDAGMCGLDWKVRHTENACRIESFRLKVDTTLHEEYYNWLHFVYKEIEKQLEDVGRHPKRDPEWLAKIHAESINKPRRRGEAKHTCGRSNFKLLKVLDLDQYGHPIRNKTQYIKGLIICLNCGLVFTTSAKYVEYSMTSMTKLEWESVRDKVSEESRKLLLKYDLSFDIITDNVTED